MGQPRKWSAATKRLRGKLINDVFESLSSRGFEPRAAILHLAKELDTSDGVVYAWREHRSLPHNKFLRKLQEIAAMSGAVRRTPEAGNGPVAGEKTTVMSNTVVAVNALVEHFTLTDLIGLNAHIGDRIAEKHQSRNG